MDLDRLFSIRLKTADSLSEIALILDRAELEGEKGSGKLGLAQEIDRLSLASEHLRQGVFRLLVLGDMKRGKSTFLNALLGQNLLPSDVNPCTALLTTLKYGKEEKVKIYYNDGKSPEKIDFRQFKQQYTIDPDEAKILERGKQLAFPDIDRAIVEHPLPILGKGIEFIDTPGLNDTEARNQLSLEYIYSCHAVLFVLSASQPCTLEERRYLQNYLRDPGVSVFFLINGWDRIRDGLLDPEDPEAVREAEEKVRQVFRANLAEYCQENDRDLYRERVFEISSLKALRGRLKDPAANLEGTGFPEFIAALNRFLIKNRAAVEIERAKLVARQACDRFSGSIERRIPLLEETVEELQQKIASVESDFEKLAAIGKQFQQEIEKVRDREVQEIADSFKTYILDLEKTFSEDFLSDRPDLDFRQFLDKNERAMFYTSFKRAFERYLNDRLAAWEFMAKQKLAAAFSQLAEKGANYQLDCNEILETINNKLLGYRFYAVEHTYKPDRVAIWSDAVGDVFGAVPDTLNKGIGSFNMFWQSVFSCVCATLVLQAIGVLFAGITLSFLGAVLTGMGVVGLQAEYVRRQFIEATKKEFSKYLPQIAEEQGRSIYQSVIQCFDVYEKQAIERFNADINSRKAELDNLLEQKQSREIDFQAETKRLQTLESEIISHLRQIEVLRESI